LPVSAKVKKNEIEDIYPLSPLQQGLLFHALYAPRGGFYLTQMSWTYCGQLKVEALAQAWQEVINRREVLRTSFAWEGLTKPMQVVMKSATMPLCEEDWREFSREQQEERLAEYFTRDRGKNFKLTFAPLMRFAIIRMGESERRMIWSYHHLLLDGWSVPLVLSDVFRAYRAIEKGEQAQLDRARPYKDYVIWLMEQKLEGAEKYWRDKLRGLNKPTEIGRKTTEATGAASRHEKRLIGIDEETSMRLQQAAQSHQLTLSTILQALWAMLLSHRSGQQDVSFGAVVSGRPPTLRGAEKMVGVFINTLPVKLNVRRDEGLIAWMKRLQMEQAEARQYEHAPLVEIQRWSELQGAAPLFKSLFVFQNYSVDASGWESLDSAELDAITDLRCMDVNHYPITFTSGPGPCLPLELNYDCQAFDSKDIDRMFEQFQTLIAAIIENPEATVGKVMERLGSNDESASLEKLKQQGAAMKRFKRVKPSAFDLSPAGLIKTRFLGEGSTLPQVIEPALSGVDLVEWAGGNLDFIDGQLLKHGALLFRGFDIDLSADFERFAATVCGRLFMENGEHPRKSVSGKVYTPVFYPPEKFLLWHNENSFNHYWPTKILFGCLSPAAQGGQTPVVDSRKVFQRMSDQIRAQFENKGVMYIRNYGGGLGLDWQTVFQTDDKTQVEQECRNVLMSLEWKEDDRLRTRCIRPGIVRHPRTGEPVWFNQAQHWHVSCLDQEISKTLRSSLSDEDLPRHCYYGDGSPIADSIMGAICEVYQELEVVFDWQKGDILLLDNLLTAHARKPFSGDREILVAMGEMASYTDL
jgi:condensation domain-containing protein/TfdA family taurine catabolism dioxygenase TauD